MKAKKKTKSRLLKLIEWLHLWPSLVSAVIVIFVCLTGTIVVFADEIIDWVNRDVLYVEKVGEKHISEEQLFLKFREAFPERNAPGYMVTYRNPRRTVKFNSFTEKKSLHFVYMDPYTGKILKDDATLYFFFITAHLHNSLLLGKTGEWIVDISTIIFAVGLITGIVLWWPKKWNKKGVQKSFTIRWKARFKRLNYDLHNILGFYALSLTFVLAITGLIIAFHPLAEATVSLFGGDPSHSWEEQLPPQDSAGSTASIAPVIQRYYAKYPEVEAVQIGTFFLDEKGYYEIHPASWVGIKNYVGYVFFINRYTGEEITIPEKARLHEEIENIWWMLHMGSWMGIWSKTLTFITGLIATSLPITGFIIWWGGRKKKKVKNHGTSPRGMVKN